MQHHRPKPAKNLLYGFHAVREAWLNPAREVQNLYLTPQAQAGFEATLDEARRRNLARPKPETTEKQRLEKILPQGAVHQGVALAAADLPETDLQDLIIRTAGKPSATLAMLDQVTDPHNVGAIIRSAAAFGLDGIIMQSKHAPDLGGVLAKTACGGIEHVPAVYETNLNRALERLKEEEFFIYGLDERGAQSLYGLGDRPAKAVIVLGAEGPGLRHLVRENCDVLLRLPTQPPIGSLNVSNAAAITFYEFQRSVPAKK